MLMTLSGGAGAGKTTLAEALAATAARGRVQVFHCDDYYFQRPGQGVWSPDETGELRLDVGDPKSIDLTRLTRDAGTALAGPAAVVVVEGLFARHITPQVPVPRFDIFVDLPADLRLARKIHRKCVRDGFPLDVLLRNYVSRRTAHEQHIEPLRSTCDLVVDAAVPSAELAQRIWTAIRTS
ncbi:hypothetical protein AB0G74_16875 [Streptomyces sp. NPDC020875]|uniref:uridine kinase family protein n=1 Tax=Streptomyces sp. NPDC020875 TaxID=3154898 RepID=UPI0033F62081